ncbi:hypothetical protein Rhe02_01410 [Rhizocola hellebori]|uniref:Uncharacterized protein n=1 Tax=Rhizocola hellebori TaxID=1392758 RepID=A0A8J3Q244_9ACTN|nr:hypothetical protein Rhe02_01410 [Rhizocola hellebori]
MHFLHRTQVPADRPDKLGPHKLIDGVDRLRKRLRAAAHDDDFYCFGGEGGGDGTPNPCPASGNNGKSRHVPVYPGRAATKHLGGDL